MLYRCGLRMPTGLGNVESVGNLDKAAKGSSEDENQIAVASRAKKRELENNEHRQYFQKML